jgi:hypothetical protein
MGTLDFFKNLQSGRAYTLTGYMADTWNKPLGASTLYQVGGNINNPIFFLNLVLPTTKPWFLVLL